MKPGDKHLDIGCGWGTLIAHAAKNYGTHSTGITLAKEQARLRPTSASRTTAWRTGQGARRRLPQPARGEVDKITCLEMAEHVGIKNFQKFLLQVRGMLKDDGIFYLQIAGLRRAVAAPKTWCGASSWASTSSPAPTRAALSASSCEPGRARGLRSAPRGELRRPLLGSPFSKWYENWKRNEAAIVAKYGQRWYRMWMMFLGWSVIIAAPGQLHRVHDHHAKNTKTTSRRCPEEAEEQAYSRSGRWIGPNPVATQQ